MFLMTFSYFHNRFMRIWETPLSTTLTNISDIINRIGLKDSSVVPIFDGHYWTSSSHSESPKLSLVPCSSIFPKLSPPPGVLLQRISFVLIHIFSHGKLSHSVRLFILITLILWSVLKCWGFVCFACVCFICVLSFVSIFVFVLLVFVSYVSYPLLAYLCLFCLCLFHTCPALC